MTFPRSLALALLAVSAALAALLVACGSSRPGSAPVDDAAADSATVDGGDAGASTMGVGVLTFSEYPDAAGTFFAGFSERVPELAANCTVVDAGPCVTTSCKNVAATDAGVTDAAATTAPNAGTLTLTGGVFGASGSGVAPDKVGTYLYASPGTIFAPGDTLGVSAAGGAVPAFPEQTVVALPPLVLTAPTSTGGKMTIAAAQPLTVAWTGGQAGAKAVLLATALFTSGGFASATCVWDASPGTGTVPSAALKPLAAANAQASGMTWYQAADTSFTVGTLAVTMSARVTQGSLATFQ